MKVREIDTRLTDVLMDKFGHPDRSPGLHASQIWHDMAVGIGRKAESVDQKSLEEYGTIGFVWERVLEKTLADITADTEPGRYMRVGERVRDGILMTPDYMDLDYFGDGSSLLGVEEWKVKWCSYRKGDNLEKNFWEWLVQQKTYCYEMETPYSRLRALFIAGDWKGDVTPKLRTWEFEWGSRELADNWEMLRGHARRRGWIRPQQAQ